ncbi:MAG: PIG-L family deacetylase [Caldilineaceae bacterium]|nr:PIG-L family deacetylase [Caldilineaceae bacterium]
MSKRVLLGIFAHPDDESFGPGGTLARYAREDTEVHIIIATDGIAGSVDDPKHLENHATLAQVRSAELARAAGHLGVSSIWSLPYRDSGMRGSPDNEHPAALIQQPVEQTVHEVLSYLWRLRPQVVVTHDPFGGYGHPDHVRVCEATTAAFHIARGEATRNGWAGPQKLYYTAFPKGLIKFMARVMPWFGKDPTGFGRNKDINLVEISRWETPVTTRIRVEPYLAYKQAASEAHASQYMGGPSWIAAIPGPLRRRLTRDELFTRAFPSPNGHTERDLFAGVAKSF